MVTESEEPKLCPLGKEGPRWTCYFCHVYVHGGHEECACSTFREKAITKRASICIPCAEAMDTLGEDTVLGRVHRMLVREADMAGRPSSDDY